MTQPRPQKKIARPTPERLPAILESLLFVAEEPMEIGALARSVNATRQGVEKALEQMAADDNGRGLMVQRLGDRVQLATIPDAAPYIEQFLEVDYGRLSRASLETLAIVAYRQPVTRAGVEAVRGVNSDHAVATLANRGLIEDVGRAPGPGRPTLFGTTVRFLEYFGLRRSDELPGLPDLPPGPDTQPLLPTVNEEAAAEDVEAEAEPAPTSEPIAEEIASTPAP